MTDLAPLSVRRRPIVNETVRRLRAIKPGERIRYYSGNPNDGGPAEYKTVIGAVFAHAEALKLAGRVELKEEKRPILSKDNCTIFITDFIAVGK